MVIGGGMLTGVGSGHVEITLTTPRLFNNQISISRSAKDLTSQKRIRSLCIEVPPAGVDESRQKYHRDDLLRQ
jgi:hypothetical protein